MTSIIDIFISPRSKKFIAEEFSLETFLDKNISKNGYGEVYSEAMSFPMYVWTAVNEKQNGKTATGMRVGVFTTKSSINAKDFSTLINLVLSYWKFHFIPDKKLREALFPGSLLNKSEEAVVKQSEKDLSIIPRGNLSLKNSKLISQGIKFLRNNKTRRFNIALHRFAASYKRTDPLDSILDCCSCLEALYNLSDELRLKISLISFHIVSVNKKKTLEKIYEMYGLRNDFIHGNKIPVVSNEQVQVYMSYTADILMSILRSGEIPNVEKLTKNIFEYYI